jgi:hypothetical protein
VTLSNQESARHVHEKIQGNRRVMESVSDGARFYQAKPVEPVLPDRHWTLMEIGKNSEVLVNYSATSSVTE